MSMDERYIVAPVQPLYTCTDCGVLVTLEARSTHDHHHDRLDAIARKAARGDDAAAMLGPLA